MSYKDEVQLIQQPDLSEPMVPPKDKKFKGYYKISRHYNWALDTTFKYGYDFVIIVEGKSWLSESCRQSLNDPLLQMISTSLQTSTNTSSAPSRCFATTSLSTASRHGMTTARRDSSMSRRRISSIAQTSSPVSAG